MHAKTVVKEYHCENQCEFIRPSGCACRIDEPIRRKHILNSHLNVKYGDVSF